MLVKAIQNIFSKTFHPFELSKNSFVIKNILPSNACRNYNTKYISHLDEKSANKTSNKLDVYFSSLPYNNIRNKGKDADSLLQKFFRDGYNINSADEYGTTILDVLVKRGYFYQVKKLIKFSNANLIDKSGNNLLHAVCDAASVSLKAYPTHERCYIEDNYLKIISALTKAGVNVNHTNHNGETPAHLASELTSPRILQELIKLGAGLNAVDSQRNKPIHRACLKGNSKVVEILLNKYKVDLESKNLESETPLLIAARRGNSFLIESLLKHGADYSVRDKYGWYSPIHIAIMSNKKHAPKIINLLVRYGAKVDEFDEFGNSPLHLACYKGNLNVVRSLIYNKANVNLKNPLDKTPLHYAAERSDGAFVDLLLASGADVCVKDIQGYTAQIIAFKNNNSKVVDLLNYHPDSQKQTYTLNHLYFSSFNSNEKIRDNEIFSNEPLPSQKKNETTRIADDSENLLEGYETAPTLAQYLYTEHNENNRTLSGDTESDAND
jgi:ankyrin repeat protein